MNGKVLQNENVASYSSPMVYVIEMKLEGCLCGSFDQTQSNDPEDYGYGGTL